MFGFLIGCDTVPMAGVTRSYTNETSINLAANCNAGCDCDLDRFDPFCGNDGVVKQMNKYVETNNLSVDVKEMSFEMER